MNSAEFRFLFFFSEPYRGFSWKWRNQELGKLNHQFWEITAVAGTADNMKIKNKSLVSLWAIITQ